MKSAEELVELYDLNAEEEKEMIEDLKAEKEAAEDHEEWKNKYQGW